MSILHNSIKRSVVKVYHEEDTDLLGNICRTSLDCDTGGEVIAGPNMEAEKRIRREIANSNERRRMQSINAGFQSLRTLLPHHEGEKLSKAAILQQTAEYIYNLEQEKTRLLSQNCQLMRQVQQHEGDVPPKKRIKTEIIMPTIMSSNVGSLGTATTTTNTNANISESSDEGVGSMSPEPVGGLVTMAELRRQLDRERNVRHHLEEQIRTMEAQLYQQQMQCHEMRDSIVTVIQEPEDIEMQLIQAENVPLVGKTETVVCCSPQMSRSSSPSRPPTPTLEGAAALTECPPPRLPSVLEAAIKAEPKVEVERLPSPSPSPSLSSAESDASCSRLYVANTSRQNLETIVEAIRHLEGDHLFSDEPPTAATTTIVTPVPVPVPIKLQPQEVPLALTTTKTVKVATIAAERLKVVGERSAVKVEMNHYLQFHTQNQNQNQHQHQHQHQQQSRPGVIVVKQHS